MGNFWIVPLLQAVSNMYKQYVHSTEIQNPTHRNLIGRNKTALPPVLSPSSILPSYSSHCAFIPVMKKPTRISKILLFQFFTILKFQ